MIRLGLGTAQFGSWYGVSNLSGKPTPNEVAQILERALELEIVDFDSAPAYGDAEVMLGNYCSGSPELKIGSKLEKLSQRKNFLTISQFLENSIVNTLKNLKQDSLDFYLLHDISDIQSESFSIEVSNCLKGFKKRGLVKMTGISLYSPEDLKSLPEDFPVDIVQVPLNPLNQCFVEHLKNLRDRGIKIQVRSLFLQGLLLMPVDQIPKELSLLKKDVERFQMHARAMNLSPMELSFSFIKSWGNEIDTVFVGVNSIRELEEVFVSYAGANPLSNLDARSFASNQGGLLDPRNWPKIR